MTLFFSCILFLFAFFCLFIKLNYFQLAAFDDSADCFLGVFEISDVDVVFVCYNDRGRDDGGDYGWNAVLRAITIPLIDRL